MSIEKHEKIKNLQKVWPLHTVAPIHWLRSQGYSIQLIHKYIKSGWLELFARGAVVRLGDQVDWQGALWGAQRTGSFHVGGKTALELQGKAHYVKFKETAVYTFSGYKETFPYWLRKATLGVNLVNTASSFLPPDIGITDYNCGEFNLKISHPIRAFLEYLLVLENHHGYDEAYYLMESLSSLTPGLIQEILEQCQSIKVKRTFLVLAKKVGVAWFPDLDLTKINLGKGPRQIVNGGKYDPEFMLTYPKVWDKEEENVVF